MLIVGCGRSGTAPTVTVAGTVTYKGEPVSDANVACTPKSGRPALGKTDAQGKFALSTFSPNDGAVEGEHTVTITPGLSGPPPMIGTPEAKNWKPPKAPFPAKYGSPKSSNLTATVKKGDKTPHDFELKD
jgi:hypothetical protein